MNTHHQSKRSGTIVVCVLVCMLVTGVLVTEVAKSALRARREVRLRQQLDQTEFLLDAGVRRAVGQLQESPSYSGETWRLDDAIPRYHQALVTINVRGDDDTTIRTVEVVASLHVAAESSSLPAADRTQRTHTFAYKLPESSTEE